MRIMIDTARHADSAPTHWAIGRHVDTNQLNPLSRPLDGSRDSCKRSAVNGPRTRLTGGITDAATDCASPRYVNLTPTRLKLQGVGATTTTTGVVAAQQQVGRSWRTISRARSRQRWTAAVPAQHGGRSSSSAATPHRSWGGPAHSASDVAQHRWQSCQVRPAGGAGRLSCWDRRSRRTFDARQAAAWRLGAVGGGGASGTTRPSACTTPNSSPWPRSPAPAASPL